MSSVIILSDGLALSKIYSNPISIKKNAKAI